MNNILKNKKAWLKSVIFAGVFAISSLSVAGPCDRSNCSDVDYLVSTPGKCPNWGHNCCKCWGLT